MKRQGWILLVVVIVAVILYAQRIRVLRALGIDTLVLPMYRASELEWGMANGQFSFHFPRNQAEWDGLGGAIAGHIYPGFNEMLTDEPVTLMTKDLYDRTFKQAVGEEALDALNRFVNFLLGFPIWPRKKKNNPPPTGQLQFWVTSTGDVPPDEYVTKTGPTTGIWDRNAYYRQFFYDDYHRDIIAYLKGINVPALGWQVGIFKPFIVQYLKSKYNNFDPDNIIAGAYLPKPKNMLA